MWKKDLNVATANHNYLTDEYLKPNGCKTKKPPEIRRFIVGPQGLEP